MGDLKTFWRNLAGILLVPTLGVAVALVLLFGRVTAVERAIESKPDSATVSALRYEIRILREQEIPALRTDIRDLRAELNRGR